MSLTSTLEEKFLGKPLLSTQPQYSSTQQLMSTPLQSTLQPGGMSTNIPNYWSVQGNQSRVPQDNTPQPNPFELNVPNPNDFYMGGGGGGVSTASLEAMRRQQADYADKQRGLVGQRRDAFINDTERAYGDQLKWLESQGDSARGGAEAGRENVNTQRDQSIASTEKTAEGEARGLRDVYQDLIVENRRRTRATGAGSSSAFLELTNKLDTQLQRGLSQVGDTKVEKVGLANTIAQQAVGELERTLQNVLAQIDQNKATSLREKDRAITEARMNADEAMLGIDKWLADSSFSIDQAVASASRASAPKFNQPAYEAAMRGATAQTVQQNLERIAQLEKQGMSSQQAKETAFREFMPVYTGIGVSPLDMTRFSGMYMGEPPQLPTNQFGLWQQQNPGSPVEDYLALYAQYNSPLGVYGGQQAQPNLNLP